MQFRPVSQNTRGIERRPATQPGVGALRRRKAMGRFLGWVLLAVCAGLGASPVGAAIEAPRKVVRQYALTSANDFPQRDPQAWQLLGSNDGGTTWTTLDVRRGEVFSGRHQRRIFALANPQAFNCYRLEIQSVSNSLEANSVQLAEIE